MFNKIKWLVGFLWWLVRGMMLCLLCFFCVGLMEGFVDGRISFPMTAIAAFTMGCAIAWLGKSLIPEQHIEKHRQATISYARAMKLLHEVVEGVTDESNMLRTIDQLFALGFTKEELVKEFHFTETEIEYYIMH